MDFKAQSPGISGAVLGVKCTDRGCQRVGLGDVKVLVTGTQSDGTSVSDTAVSDAKKGEWSLDVAPGQYTVGPTQDGSTFGGLGFDPAQQGPITVGRKVVDGVNFMTCAGHAGASGSTRSGPSRPIAMAQSAAAPPLNLVSQCQSVYTVTVDGSIPDGQIVDPGPQARFNRNDNGAPDYRGTTGWFNSFQHTWPFAATLRNREYPECFSEAQAKSLASQGVSGADISWYSYIQGPVTLPRLTVKFAFNQSKQMTSLVGKPSESVEEITKVWQWKENVAPGAGGHCQETEKIPFLYLPVPEKNGFTIVLAWGFPFNPTGVRSRAGTGLEAEFAKKMEELGPEGHRIATRFENAKEAGKFAIELAVTAVGVGKALKAFELGSEALSFALSPSTLEAMAQGVGIVHKAHKSHDLYEIAEYLDAFGSQPVMSAVINGTFTSLGKVGHQRATTLGVSVASTKFPSIALKIHRTAFAYRDPGAPPFSGDLPWANDGLGSSRSPATANPFASNEPDLVTDYVHNSYTTGTSALATLTADTEQLPWVNDSLRHGNLSHSFDEEKRSAADPPSCSTGLTPDLLHDITADTICWRFNDADA